MKASALQKIISLIKQWFILAIYFSFWFCALTFYNESALHLNNSSVIGYGFALLQAALLSKFLVTAELIAPFGSMYKSSIYWAVILRTSFDSAVVLGLRFFSAGLEGLYHHTGFIDSMKDFCQGDLKHILALTFLYWLIVLPYVAYCLLRRLAGNAGLQAYLTASRDQN